MITLQSKYDSYHSQSVAREKLGRKKCERLESIISYDDWRRREKKKIEEIKHTHTHTQSETKVWEETKPKLYGNPLSGEKKSKKKKNCKKLDTFGSKQKDRSLW